MILKEGVSIRTHKLENKRQEKAENLNKTYRLLSLLTSQNYYGKIELVYEKGLIVGIKKHDNIKPDEIENYLI